MDDYILELKNVEKSYGSVKALNKVNMTLSTGIYALLGHNGAGKSTILNILATLLKTDQGEVLFNNQSISSLGDQYRDILGYMPQHQQLVSYQNVESFLFYIASMKAIPKNQTKEIVFSLLESVNLTQHRKKRLISLSGGMKQRVLIAQALLNNPVILLLDEPTAGLDPVERRSFRELIARIAENKIVVLATHVISDVEWIADQIIMMKNGEVLTISKQEELIENTHVYESFDPVVKLKEFDQDLKVVNQIRVQGKIKTRFISKLSFENKVSTYLDDVYLDWLG